MGLTKEFPSGDDLVGIAFNKLTLAAGRKLPGRSKIGQGETRLGAAVASRGGMTTGGVRVMAMAVARDGPRIHVFRALMVHSYTVPGTKDTAPTRTDRNPCPPGAYHLDRRERQMSKL